MILGELEHLESLVRLARRKKDLEVTNNQMFMVFTVSTLGRFASTRHIGAKPCICWWK